MIPSPDCALCPRLAAFRGENRRKLPAYHNAPVPSYGQDTAPLLIVGLAPGLHGANQTGRPFTGDFAGDLLYQTLSDYGFASGCYDRHAGDGLRLVNCRITNAVRCVPPENKPETAEITQCNRFLAAEITSVRPRIILALGLIAHQAALKALGYRAATYKFAHAARHEIGAFTLYNSYHCSQYNQNTGRLTPAMFQSVFAEIKTELDT